MVHIVTWEGFAVDGNVTYITKIIADDIDAWVTRRIAVDRKVATAVSANDNFVAAHDFTPSRFSFVDFLQQLCREKTNIRLLPMFVL